MIKIIETTFRFTQGPKGMTVAVSYDTGWNEGLDCGGKGGWMDEVAFNEDDAAVFRIRNIRTGNRATVCGVRNWRGMVFAALVLDERDGFEITKDDQGVTVVCSGGSSLEYEPAEPPPVK